MSCPHGSARLQRPKKHPVESIKMPGASQNIYSPEVLAWSKTPYKKCILPNYHVKHDSQNPLCGDTLSLYLRLGSEEIEAASFEGECCSICRLSSSCMIFSIEGKPYPTAQGLANQVSNLFAANSSSKVNPSQLPPECQRLWQSLAAFPVRHKCASFPWQSLLELLQHQNLIEKAPLH